MNNIIKISTSQKEVIHDLENNTKIILFKNYQSVKPRFKWFDGRYYPVDIANLLKKRRQNNE